eukprot:3839557-Alexandrium_andersonii.AAC.1
MLHTPPAQGGAGFGGVTQRADALFLATQTRLLRAHGGWAKASLAGPATEAAKRLLAAGVPHHLLVPYLRLRAQPLPRLRGRSPLGAWLRALAKARVEAHLRDPTVSASDRARVRSAAGQWAGQWLGGLSRGAAPLTDH